MSFNECMNTPIIIFLSLYKQFIVKELMKNEDYAKQIKKQKYLNAKDADIGAIRRLSGYKKKTI